MSKPLATNFLQPRFRKTRLVMAMEQTILWLAAGALVALSTEVAGRSSDTSAALATSQVIRQFTLRNGVGQANQMLQGFVVEVSGKLRGAPMGPPGSFFPATLGTVPVGFGLPQLDGNGRPLGYCAWDNTTDSDSTNYRGGLSLSNQMVFAVVSPGLNGAFETNCDSIEAAGAAGGDDFLEIRLPAQVVSQQYRSAVATVAALASTAGEEGDVRLVLENNQLYSHINGGWQPVANNSFFADDSATNGAGAIAYTTGKVTVADFQATVATLSSNLAVGGTANFTGAVTANAGISVAGGGLTVSGASTLGNTSITGTTTITGALSATTLAGNGAGLTDLNAGNINAGVLGAAYGGTGVNAGAAANGALLIGNGSGFGLGMLNGTADQVIVSNGAGSITLSLPQSIAMASVPTFGGMVLNGALSGTSATLSGNVTAQRLIASDTTVIGATGAATSGTLLNKKLQVTGDIGATGNIAIDGTFTGNGSGLTNLNASNFSSGTVPVARGGTGLGTTPTNGQLLIGNGTGYTLANIIGTANQVNVSNGAGSIALSLPQNIATTSSPTFVRLSLSDSSGGVTIPNLVIGSGALAEAQSGAGGNTAVGVQALNDNTSGYNSTALGYEALGRNTTGYSNTAVGRRALLNNLDGNTNTSIGNDTMVFNTSGSSNIAVGSQALNGNTTGSWNIVLGRRAMLDNTIGEYNMALGGEALRANISGFRNIAIGQEALRRNTSGARNVALGDGAGYATSGGVITNANATGSNNTFLGSYAMPGTTTQLTYATALGSESLVTTSDTIVLGRTTDTTVIGATGAATSGTLLNKKLQVTGDIGATGNIAIDGTFTGNGSGLTNLNASNFSSGTVPVARGGTGLGTTPTNGQLLIGNGTGYTLANLTGTANQVNVSNGAGSIALSLPQDIATTSSPSFRRLSLGDSSTVTVPNVVIGSGAMAAAQSGYGSNLAVGVNALSANTSGFSNVAIGYDALKLNTTGGYNFAIGSFTLTDNIDGYDNIALGHGVLTRNTSGLSNTAVGSGAMHFNTTGNGNIAMGEYAMRANTTGSDNVAVGQRSLFGNTTGARNVALGDGAGYATSGGVITNANTTGSNNTFLGANAMPGTATQLAYATALGSDSLVTTSNTIVLGRTTDTTVIGATGAASSGTLLNKKLQVTGDIGATGNIAIDGALSTTSNASINGVLSVTGSGSIPGQSAQISATRNGRVLNFLVSANASAFSPLTLAGDNLIFFDAGGINTGTLVIAPWSDTGVGMRMSSTGTNFGGSVTFSGSTSFTRLNVADATGVFTPNLAVGTNTLAAAQSGDGANTAVGINALSANTSGARNVGVGYSAISQNTTGSDNTALGWQALSNNTTGERSVAVGSRALFGNTTGVDNIAVGWQAMQSNSSGGNNAAVGWQAMASNTVGNFNVAMGKHGLRDNTTGSWNTAIGQSALVANTTGSRNVALGDAAGFSTPGNVSTNANITGSNNTFLGSYAMPGTTTQLTYATALGSESLVTTSDTIVLGRTTDTTVIGATGTASSGTLLNKKLQVTGDIGATGNIAIDGTFTGNGSGLTNLNASNFSSGTLSVARGGTGLSTTPTNGQLLIGNGTGYTMANIIGTANQVNVSNGAGSIALSLPQDIATTSSPTFVRLSLSDSSGGVTIPNFVIGSGAMAASQLGYGSNMAIGINALNANTSGHSNMAIGLDAMRSNTTGEYNMAVGIGAMESNVTGGGNTAVGWLSLNSNTDGSDNTALGESTLRSNTNGTANTAVGGWTLFRNTTGNRNTAVGDHVLFFSTIATENTGLGYYSMYNTTGSYNVAIGERSLFSNTTGASNVALGDNAGHATSGGVSTNANTTGSNNTFLGSYAMPGTTTQLTYATALGSDSRVTTSSTVVLGRTTDTTVIGATGAATSGNLLGGKLQVTGDIRASGNVFAAGVQLTSDRRLKTDIQAMGNDQILDNLGQLSAYKYRLINDPTGQVRVGVMAQELATLFPELAQMGAGGFYSVDYSALGTLAAAGVGKLAVKHSELQKKVDEEAKKLADLGVTVDKMDSRVSDLEAWRTTTNTRMDGMQKAIDLNIENIAKNALKIAIHEEKITKLESVTVNLDTRMGAAEGRLDKLENDWTTQFSRSEDGSTLTVRTPNLVAGNFMAEQIKARAFYAERLEAEMVRIRELEVDNLRANTAVARNVQAETVNTGSAQVYAGAGLPAFLFAAPSDGHYTVNTSSMDGSYATATVIVNGGMAKVVPIASEGIELIAVGNTVKAVAAGKSVRASWIKMG